MVRALELPVTLSGKPVGEQVVLWLATVTSDDRGAAEELRARGRHLDCAALQPLAAALLLEGAFPRLVRLDLSGNLLADDSCMQLAGCALALQRRPIGGLRSLAVAGNQIGAEGAAVLAESFFPSSSSSGSSSGAAAPDDEYALSLSENPIGDNGVVAVASTVRLRECRAALQLADVSCGSAGCNALVQGREWVVALDLGYNPLPTGAVNMLVGALGPPLRRLGLCHVAPGGRGGLFRGPTVQALAASLSGSSPPPLVALGLTGNDLQDAGLRQLVDAIATEGAPAVQELELAANRLQDGNLLAKVLATGHLVSLSLESNELNDLALVAIAAGVSLSPRLQHLNLAKNRFGDAGVQALALAVQNQCSTIVRGKGEVPLLRSPALARWLRGLAGRAPEAPPSGCGGAAGAAGDAAEDEGRLGMRHLDLSFNFITDEGARKLADAVLEAAASGAPNLRQLNLYDTSIVGPGRDALEGAIRASQMRVRRIASDACIELSGAGSRGGMRLHGLPQPLLVQGLGLESLDEDILANAKAWYEGVSASVAASSSSSRAAAATTETPCREAPSAAGSAPATGAGAVGVQGAAAHGPPLVEPTAGELAGGPPEARRDATLERTDEVLERARRSLPQAPAGAPERAPPLPLPSKVPISSPPKLSPRKGWQATPMTQLNATLQNDAKKRTEAILSRARDVLQQAQASSLQAADAAQHSATLPGQRGALGALAGEGVADDAQEAEGSGSDDASPQAERCDCPESPQDGSKLGLSWATGTTAPWRREPGGSAEGCVEQGRQPSEGSAPEATLGPDGGDTDGAFGVLVDAAEPAVNAAVGVEGARASAKPPGPAPPPKAAADGAGSLGATEAGVAAGVGSAPGAAPLVLPPPPPKASKGKGKGGPPSRPKAPPKSKAPSGKAPAPKAKALGAAGSKEASKGPFHRKIYWKPLDLADAEGTIFSPAQRERARSCQPIFDAEALKKMFEGEASKASRHSRKSEGLLNKVQLRSVGTKLLSDHRARNIAIILKRLPVSTKDLTHILKGLVWEVSELSADDLELILEVIPTQDEAEKLREHKVPEAKMQLRDVEQLVLPLALLSRGASRVRLLCIARSARSQFGSTARSLAAIRAACKAVHRSQMLREVMLLALEMGNYINHGDSKKGAKAITVGSLMTLRDFKTGRMSSLHFLCASLLRAEPDRDASEVLQRELRPAANLAQLQVSNLQAAHRSFQRDLEIITVESRSFLQEYAETIEVDHEANADVAEDDDGADEELEEYEALPTNEMEVFDDEVEDATRWVEDVMKIRGSARRRLLCMRRVMEKLCSLLAADMLSTSEQAKAALRFCGMPPPSSQDLPPDLEVLLQQLAEFLRVFKQHWDEVNRDLSSYQQLFSGGTSTPKPDG